MNYYLKQSSMIELLDLNVNYKFFTEIQRMENNLRLEEKIGLQYCLSNCNIFTTFSLKKIKIYIWLKLHYHHHQHYSMQKNKFKFCPHFAE